MQLGSTVTLVYTGKLDDGTVFGFADADNPMKFQTGMDMTIDGFEKAILEMNEVGEKKSFVVNEYEGYGEYLEDYVAKIPAEQIPRHGHHRGQTHLACQQRGRLADARYGSRDRRRGRCHVRS